MIGECDNCHRRNVPVHSSSSAFGDTTQCYLCRGDTDPDPYGEMKEMTEAFDMVERLIQAAVDYERADTFYAKSCRQELSEARAAVEKALSASRGCICQDAHRRGYCTEPGCDFAVASAQRGALKPIHSLINEVAGIWDAFEIGLRQEISNTNYAVVKQKLTEAELAVARLPVVHAEQPAACPANSLNGFDPCPKCGALAPWYDSGDCNSPAENTTNHFHDAMFSLGKANIGSCKCHVKSDHPQFHDQQDCPFPLLEKAIMYTRLAAQKAGASIYTSRKETDLAGRSQPETVSDDDLAVFLIDYDFGFGDPREVSETDRKTYGSMARAILSKFNVTRKTTEEPRG